MDKFTNNIIQIYKTQGKHWLDNLPSIVNKLAFQWNLTDLKAVNNLSYNYVAKGFQNHLPIILKIGLDKEAILNEYKVLKFWNGHGAVKVLNYDSKFNALLLNQAINGSSLLSYAETDNKFAIKRACIAVTKIHENIPQKSNFINIKEWLQILDQDWEINSLYLDKARKLRDHLLDTTITQTLLHSDLHHDNIIHHQNNEWLIIDPKGVIGDPVSEYWAIMRDPTTEIALISNLTNYCPIRIRDWSYVRTILSICWCFEDKTNPSIFLNFIEKLEKIY